MNKSEFEAMLIRQREIESDKRRLNEINSQDSDDYERLAAILKNKQEMYNLNLAKIWRIIEDEHIDPVTRHFIKLRYFDNSSWISIGTHNGVAPDSARMRVERFFRIFK